MFTPPWALLALAYHLASRLAYVLYIGLALGRQERTGYLTLRHGAEGGFRRFRRLGATLMYNDAASFVLLCVATWGTRTGRRPPAPFFRGATRSGTSAWPARPWAPPHSGGGPTSCRTSSGPGEGKAPCTAAP